MAYVTHFSKYVIDNNCIAEVIVASFEVLENNSGFAQNKKAGIERCFQKLILA